MKYKLVISDYDGTLGCAPQNDIDAKTLSAIKKFQAKGGKFVVCTGRMFASVHIEVDQNIDIVHCHEQIDLCEKEIYDNLGVALVIHMDPMDVNNEEVAFVRQQLSDGIKVINKNFIALMRNCNMVSIIKVT